MTDHFTHGPFMDATVGDIMFDKCAVCGYLIYRGRVTMCEKPSLEDILCCFCGNRWHGFFPQGIAEGIAIECPACRLAGGKRVERNDHAN
jgi:hypothetical protein